jgi:CRP-like cAMP-binding protein
VNLDQTLQRMVCKFSHRAPLQESDVAELLRLPFTQKAFEAGRYLVREGAPTHDCVLLLSGFAYRHKLTADGERQIVSVHIAGDFMDLEGSLLKIADHNVQALTRCEVATIPAAAIIDLIDRHPRIGRAMWVDTLIDGSIFREWIMNVGRRPAKQRIAHLLCELGRRQEVAGLSERTGYDFPMTQEHLADATGLTPVHVNRTLRALQADGLIAREKRHIHIPDWERLRDLAGFSELYLHLDQVT